MKSEHITEGLDLLGDFLDAKGYTEEAGLCTKAMDEINRLQAELIAGTEWFSARARVLEELATVRAENARLQKDLHEYEQAMMALQLLQRAEADVKLRAENAKLRQAMHDIYEVYAGSEGFKPETCAEAYLQERILEMAYIATKHKRAALGDE